MILSWKEVPSDAGYSWTTEISWWQIACIKSSQTTREDAFATSVRDGVVSGPKLLVSQTMHMCPQCKIWSYRTCLCWILVLYCLQCFFLFLISQYGVRIFIFCDYILGILNMFWFYKGLQLLDHVGIMKRLWIWTVLRLLKI